MKFCTVTTHGATYLFNSQKLKFLKIHVGRYHLYSLVIVISGETTYVF